MIQITLVYPLVNELVDPENDQLYQFIVQTSLPTPMTGRVELLIYQRVRSLPSDYLT